MLDFTKLKLEDVRGVGTIELDLEPGKQAYVFIGENGIGKTKLLESLLTYILFPSGLKNVGLFASGEHTFHPVLNSIQNLSKNTCVQFEPYMTSMAKRHDQPCVYISAKDRGYIEHKPTDDKKFGTTEARKAHYIEQLEDLADTAKRQYSQHSETAENWFVKIARSSNKFQSKEDNREIEIQVLLMLLNKLEPSISHSTLEIDGSDNVFLEINKKQRKLSELSTGFTSLVKILQTIISGFGYYTNRHDLQQVEGIVLIDEIESHLHLKWQAQIIPKLQELFPNATFIIATHSPIVISQLEEGEAYKLEQAQDNLVRSKKIDHPSNSAMIDLLDEAFDIDLNELAINRPQSNSQKIAKRELLKRLRQRNASL